MDKSPLLSEMLALIAHTEIYLDDAGLLCLISNPTLSTRLPVGRGCIETWGCIHKTRS